MIKFIPWLLAMGAEQTAASPGEPPMKLIRRVLISLVGGTVLLIGIAMILLPAPSTLVILIGLGILALEFAWARYWLAQVRQCLPGKKRAAASVIVPAPGESPK